MKKIAFGIILTLFVALYAINEMHRNNEYQWAKWKELTLDGARPEKPGPCFYCEYVKPIIRKIYEP